MIYWALIPTPRLIANTGQCPQLERRYIITNKAAIALQCKSNGKLIAALLFVVVLFEDNSQTL